MHYIKWERIMRFLDVRYLFLTFFHTQSHGDSQDTKTLIKLSQEIKYLNVWDLESLKELILSPHFVYLFSDNFIFSIFLGYSLIILSFPFYLVIL